MSKKKITKINPIAKALRNDQQFKQKVVKLKTAYDRKKIKKNDED